LLYDFFPSPSLLKMRALSLPHSLKGEEGKEERKKRK